METEDLHKEDKIIHCEVYETLAEVEKALEVVKKHHFTNLQISILGTLKSSLSGNEISLEKEINKTKRYWKDTLGEAIDFGYFDNTETGVVFVVGQLAPTFLQKIDGKLLTNMSSGFYSILRGIGASEQGATKYLKKLIEGNYILILRGFATDMNKLKAILEQQIDS